MKRIIHLFLLFFCLKSFAQQELIVPLPAMIVEDYDFCKSWLVSVHSKKDSITVPLNSSLFHEQLKNQSVLALRTQFFSNNYIITLFLIGDAYGYELLNYKRTKFKKCRKRSKFKVFFKEFKVVSLEIITFVLILFGSFNITSSFEIFPFLSLST